MPDQIWLEQISKHKKIIYVYKKNQSDRELNCEAESEHWFENLLSLAI